jgi:hypothetical protein
MAPATDPRGQLRRVSTLIALLPLIVWGASSLAANAPRVDHPHGSFKGECGLCHGAASWKPAKIGRE